MKWIVVLFLVQFIVGQSDEEDRVFRYVTCGSVVKLVHEATGYRLHSHDINWGSGSGQQSVTAVSTDADVNSLWQVSNAYGSIQCLSGTPISCGSVVRLKHVRTQNFLHSHLHQAPLSHAQEVSSIKSLFEVLGVLFYWRQE